MKIATSASEINRITETAGNLGWTVTHVPSEIEFEKYSPLGEDFIIVSNGNTVEEIMKDVDDIYAGFDPGRHVLEHLAAENEYSYMGVEIVRSYADDAEAIDSMLKDLLDALRELAAEIEYEIEGEDDAEI